MKFAHKITASLLTACTLTACTNMVTTHNDLDFSKQSYTKKSTQVNGQTITYRAYENIVYVRYPADRQYQTINIYIPEAYFNGESINGYTAQTAPIFFPNKIGGYMPAQAGVPGKGGLGRPQEGKADAMQTALAQGLVVASAGARGRTTTNGKAPAAIIDLKAAIRYLKANDSVMAGDANKIIANGTSAGGALSILLGATANETDYQSYLNELGAAQAQDNIFAISSYCPISILEHADAAYEWQFNGVNNYQKIDVSMLDYQVQRKPIKGTLSEQQQKISSQLKPLFSSYINELNLTYQGKALSLDKNGNGSFKTYVAIQLAQAAQQQINAGIDLSNHTWLTVRNGKVTHVDLDQYSQTVGRQKTPPAFDGLDLSTGENQLFGNQTTDKQHFTEFSMKNSIAHNPSMADAQHIKMMNPMNYLTTQTQPQHWRIRVGTNDRDTSLAISTILATKLKNIGKSVDYKLAWDKGHGGDYDLDELFAWIDKIAK